MKQEVGSKGTQTAKVINSEWDKSNVLGIEGRDDFVALGGLRSVALKFRVDAGQVGPGDERNGSVSWRGCLKCGEW